VYSKTKKDLNSGKPECEKWENTTIGSEVQATVDRAVGSKTHRLEIATDLNQIVSALVNQIVIQAFGGLSGGNSSYSSGRNDYEDTLRSIGNKGREIIEKTTGATSTATTSTSTRTYLDGQSFTLTVTSNPASGVVRGLQNPYLEGHVAVLEAPIISGKRLDNWTGCTSVSNKICYVIMDSDKSVIVNMKND